MNTNDSPQNPKRIMKGRSMFNSPIIFIILGFILLYFSYDFKNFKFTFDTLHLARLVIGSVLIVAGIIITVLEKKRKSKN